MATFIAEVKWAEGEEWVEQECEIEYEYDPGDPGRTWGPWEYCYPPEPAQVVINSIWTQPRNKGSKNVLDYLSDKEILRLEELAFCDAEKDIDDWCDYRDED
jgi:hypothetical protein